MVLEIANTILLFLIFALNYRILSIVNTLRNKNIITKPSTLADDIMSCDNCESCESCINCNNYNKKNNCLNYNEDKIKLLETNKENKQKEWTEIEIVK